jgi:hypothetical protein
MKASLRQHLLPEILAQAGTSAWAGPLSTLRYLAGGPCRRPVPPMRDFLGLAVGLDRVPWQRHAEELQAIDVRHILVRVGVWQLNRLPEFQALLRALPGIQVVIGVMQDRSSLACPGAWERALLQLVPALWPWSRCFQFGQAINRLKWGCAHVGQGLDLAERAEALLRPRFPKLQTIAPSTLDFEPLAQLRSLVHARRVRWHAASFGLYVDRRGPPEGRQYGHFDLARKIRFLASIASCSRRCAPRVWITESNWPLADTGGYAPASPEYQVDAARYADYLRRYVQIARNSGVVQRLYWWQLLATGYGLIDNRDGRRRPAWHVFRELLT